jgi:pyruvate/2-oxoglutarate dehydrogenase complex dihydrolipoamide acyltransferase (E2) component
MPHEVIMPALGMAQDTGLIVAWHKSPGDAVASGEVLFEVETDKSTVEVEAGADGFVTQVRRHAGDEVPVGEVIALIGDSTEAVHTDESPAAAPDQARDNELPEGNAVIMPALGMAQDTGVIVAWHKAPGDAVAASEVLFEVETDKATMDVDAGFDGYVAALLAEAGEEAPVGDKIAVISAEKPNSPVQRSRAGKAPAAPAAPTPAPAKPPEPEKATRAGPAQTPAFTGKVLASPKARRLALEQGLDLARLAAEGHPMPYHVADLDTLRALPDKATLGSTATAHINARVPVEAFAGFTAFLDGAAAQGAVWASFAGASLRAATGAKALVVRLDRPTLGTATFYADPDLGPFSQTAPVDDAAPPTLILRDLTASRITGGTLGTAEAPVLSITRDGENYALSLAFAPGALDTNAAIALIDGFAGRLAEPLRHLL